MERVRSQEEAGLSYAQPWGRIWHGVCVLRGRRRGKMCTHCPILLRKMGWEATPHFKPTGNGKAARGKDGIVGKKKKSNTVAQISISDLGELKSQRSTEC